MQHFTSMHDAPAAVMAPAISATADELREEIKRLWQRLEAAQEAEETLRAIQRGDIDALMIEGPAGPRVFTLQGLDAESNRFRGEILAQVNDAVIVVDPEQRITYLNAAAEKLYGVSGSEALGRALSEIYETVWLDADDEMSSIKSLASTGRWLGENMHRKRGGQEIHVESSMSRLRGPDGDELGLLAVIRDISARKQAEEDLRQSEQQMRCLNQELEERVLKRTAQLRESLQALQVEAEKRQQVEREILEISEREQARIGQDLHDGIGQQLAGTAFLSDALVRQLQTDQHPMAEAAGKISQHIRSTIESARELAKGLYPFELNHQGLLESLRSLARTTTRQSGIRCFLDHDDEPRHLPKSAAIHIYRIVQEAVTNAIKHGKPRQIVIDSLADPDGHWFRVTDDGVGITNDPQHHGMGLHLMQYRAMLLDASLEVTTPDTGGCQVTCRLPCKG